MSRFEQDNEDLVYTPDDVFDLGNLRAETGIVIDACDHDEIDLPGTLAAYGDSPARNREGRP